MIDRVSLKEKEVTSIAVTLPETASKDFGHS